MYLRKEMFVVFDLQLAVHPKNAGKRNKFYKECTQKPLHLQKKDDLNSQILELKCFRGV